MTTLATKKKLINLDQDTFKSLSIMAANKGTNLKVLIESKLKEIAEDFDDSLLYGYLVKTDPEGKELLAGKERDEIDALIGYKR